jgi:glycosyltransferase involved in cell wall biosynthesis
MTPPPDQLVSVIIPAYRRPEKLRAAVRSLLAQDLDPRQFELIVVDSSPDDTNAAVIAALQETARCPLRFFRKPPEGPGPSRNLGAREARGGFLAFLDSDCQASPQWLREGIAAFEAGVGIVQGRTMPEPGVPHSVFNHEFKVEQESFLYETANIIYRREAFEQVGGFLPDLAPRSDKPMGGEDVDLAWRVKRAGWQSRFAEHALVTHEVERLRPWRWFCAKKTLFICPHLVRRYPELRRFFFARYFFDKIQAELVLALVGLALAVVTRMAMVLALPYVITRVAQPSRTLRGPRRLLRVLFYLPRDLVSLGLLLAGSVRFRALLL